MRLVLVVLGIALAGCGTSRVTGTPPPAHAAGWEFRRSAETKLLIAQPGAKTPPFAPGETFECTGYFTIGPEHRALLSKPKITILSRKVTVDQVSSELGEQAADGAVPFHAKLRCPTKPGKYELRATITVTPNGEDKPTGGVVIESPHIPIEVKELEKR
jgi:hypothetical protein